MKVKIKTMLLTSSMVAMVAISAQASEAKGKIVCQSLEKTPEYKVELNLDAVRREGDNQNITARVIYPVKVSRFGAKIPGEDESVSDMEFTDFSGGLTHILIYDAIDEGGGNVYETRWILPMQFPHDLYAPRLGTAEHPILTSLSITKFLNLERTLDISVKLKCKI